MGLSDLEAQFGTLLLRHLGSRTFVGFGLIALGVTVLWAAVEFPPVPQFMTVAFGVVALVMIAIGMVPVAWFILSARKPDETM